MSKKKCAAARQIRMTERVRDAIEDLAEAQLDGRKALTSIRHGDHKEFMENIRSLKVDFKVARNSLLSAFLDSNKDFVIVNGQLMPTSKIIADLTEDEKTEGKIERLNRLSTKLAILKGLTKEDEIKQTEESLPLNPPFTIPTETKTPKEMGLIPMSASSTISNYNDDSYSGGYLSDDTFSAEMAKQGYVQLGHGAWTKVDSDGVESSVYRNGYG